MDLLNSTCDIGLIDMRHEWIKCSDMGHCLFLNSTCNNKENKRQRHAILPFLKIDMRRWGPPTKGTYVMNGRSHIILALTSRMQGLYNLSRIGYEDFPSTINMLVIRSRP